MELNHVAMYVEDLEGMKAFYEKYFHATSNYLYHNPKTGLKTYFLSFSDGARLELMTRPDMCRGEKQIAHTGLIHLAFCVGSEKMVDVLTEQLKQDGYEVLSGPRRTGDGYYESCVLDPERNQVEIVA